ncbi:hypothetical protein [Litchfieldia salsa]|uniref:Uncharacterized protein n=1 Tax=Litchfieldia salsa TaxID=930152 RepID=A0A1H0UZZ7_9BACI|nr:hypothetical protein [Litchfieldia salsa]SDP71426.1 hypothetical protein SAMN05216565_105263 [Litchfieldia salsa]
MGNFAKKYWMLYVIGGIISVIVIYIIININYNDSTLPTLSQTQIENVEKKDEAKATTKESNIQLTYDEVEPIKGNLGSQIHQIHEHYNEILTYGNWRLFEDEDYSGWETEAINAKQILSTIDVMLKETEDEALIRDLNNAKELIEASILSKNSTGLLYMHRIFHDLDIKYNNYSEKLWGYSHFKDSGRNADKVEALLKKLK